MPVLRVSLSSKNVVEMDALHVTPRARFVPPLDLPNRGPRAEGTPQQQGVIDSYIDRQGSVQLPRGVSATDMALGWAVAKTVRRWIYQVPTVKGEPVFVHREMRFTF